MSGSEWNALLRHASHDVISAVEYRIPSHDEAGHDDALLPPVKGANSIGEERDPVKVAAHQINAGYARNKHITHGNRFYQLHCTALHDLPPMREDPNVDECAHFQALVATDSFVGAVHQASVVHRHAYIMVNGVPS